MKIQINNSKILDLSISELYDYCLLERDSFHHWLTRKSGLKIPQEADTSSWFFCEESEENEENADRLFSIDLIDYLEWWSPIVTHIRHQKVDAYKVVGESKANVKFAIYLNDYPEDYWGDSIVP
jgi:hypothetical protein